AAAMHELLAVLGAEDMVRSSRRADHDVGFGGGLVELIERNDPAVEGFSKLAGAFHCAICDEDRACSLLNEVARCEFAHLSGSNEEDSATVERAENLAREVDGYGGDGDGVGPDCSLSANFLGGCEGRLKQMLELAGYSSGGTGRGESLFDLTENLRFANDHRVET